MKYIVISGSIVGRSIQYEHLGRRGRKRFVPTYYGELCDDANPQLQYTFAVTRDSAWVVFGKRTRRYTKGGECPPHKQSKPYHARVRIAKRNGWCLALYEPGFTRPDGTPDWSTLEGIGSIKRRHTLIHAGPASGQGCMSVAGGKRGFAQFRKAVERILEPEEELYVFVEPRPEKHHNRHLSR